MDTKEFWKLIDESRRLSGSDLNRQGQCLFDLLAKLPPEKIAAFGHRFDSYDIQLDHYDIWAAAFIVRGGCSDDSFDDFRGSMIALGEDLVTALLQDPDNLRNFLDKYCYDDPEHELFVEGFSSIAARAYAEVTGKDLPRLHSEPYEGTKGEPWNGNNEEAELKRRCPRLWNRFCFDEEEEFQKHRSKATELFRAKKYSQALKAFQKIEDELGPTDLKKLEYCKRKA